MVIQCLIQRDGPTVVTKAKQKYIFQENRHGDSVCEVQNQDHALLFLKMGERYYKPYDKAAKEFAERNMNPNRRKEAAKKQNQEEAPEVFEESAPIKEGADGDQEVPTEAGEEAEPFEEMETAEQVMTELGEGDVLTENVVKRLVGKGEPKAAIVKVLQKDFEMKRSAAYKLVGKVMAEPAETAD